MGTPFCYPQACVHLARRNYAPNYSKNTDFMVKHRKLIVFSSETDIFTFTRLAPYGAQSRAFGLGL